MNLPITFASATACIVFTVVFGWLGSRPSRPGRIRLAPWRFMMLLAFTALIATAVHLVSLVRGDVGKEVISQESITR